MNEELLQDLPQLIVALDSDDDAANYVHIKDIKDNMTYYCPCCKGIIKPRAYKNDKKYKVQPHFYHENGGCSDETYIHYICKNWLFESGCKFIVDNIEYVVDNIEVEKTMNTSFGIYRPDIIVNTTSGKIFYFEIKSTNKKTELYAPKWDELGNDVVEVDARYFINQKCSSSIPEFKLIYSDGQCFIKSYTKKDYDDVIAKRKLEWKRQDKLNYKIQWEKLDWFWIKLQDYLYSEYKDSKFDELLRSFKKLNFEDMNFCLNIIKKHKLNRSLEPIYNMVEYTFKQELEKYNIHYVKELSPRKRVFRLLVHQSENIKIYEEVILKANFNKLNMDIISELLLTMEYCTTAHQDKIINKCEDLSRETYGIDNIHIESSINYIYWDYKNIYGDTYDCYHKYIDCNNNTSYKSCCELKANRELEVLKETFSVYLDCIKNMINKNKAWNFYYSYLCSYSYKGYTPAIKMNITFNNRNSSDFIILMCDIDMKNIIEDIKNILSPIMNKLIRKDGYIKTKYNYLYGNKIYCEKDRLIMVNKQEGN